MERPANILNVEEHSGGFSGGEIPTSNIKIQNKSQIQDPKSQEEIPNQKSQGNGKPYDLRERLLLFSKDILKICKRLPKISECENIRKQLSRAATSIGANFEEADGALSSKDFMNKVGISRKEAKETRYWLRITANHYLNERELAAVIGESEEIICILSSILIKSGYKNRFS